MVVDERAYIDIVRVCVKNLVFFPLPPSLPLLPRSLFGPGYDGEKDEWAL